MKVFRKTIILILILGVLCGALYYVLPSLNNQEKNDVELLYLVEYNSYELDAFSVLGGEYDFYFKRDANDSWTMKKPKAEISATSIDNVALEICAISATKTIAENVKNSQLADYGLDEPITVNVTPKKGKKYSVELGNQEPTRNGYYFRMAGESTVYLMSNYKAQMILTNFKNLCDTTLINCKQEEISGFTLKKNGAIQFDITNYNNVWKIDAPIKGMSRDYVIEEILPLMTNIVVEEVFSLEPNDKEYGFDKPSYEFTLKTTGGTRQTIIIGKERTAGVYYAKSKGRSSVVLLPLSKITFIDKKLKDILDTSIYLQDITKTDKVVVTYKGNRDEIDIAYSKKEDKDKGTIIEKEEFVFNGHDVSYLSNSKTSKLLVKEFYESFVALIWYELDYSVKPKYTKPVLKIEYTTSDGEKVKVEYIRKNNDFSYYFLNGKYAGMVVDNSQFENITNTRKNLVDEVNRRNSK